MLAVGSEFKIAKNKHISWQFLFAIFALKLKISKSSQLTVHLKSKLLDCFVEDKPQLSALPAVYLTGRRLPEKRRTSVIDGKSNLLHSIEYIVFKVKAARPTVVF